MGWLSKIFGGTKKRDTTYQGTRPPRSITDSPLGKTLTELLMQKMQGANVGFDPSFVGRTTSPVIAQREARFKEYEMPELSSQLSSRGMGRSTVGVDLMRRAGAAKERDISSILGEAYRAQEIQKRGEIGQALGLTPGVVGQEMGVQGRYSGFEQSQHLRELQEEQQRRQNRALGLQRLIGSGANLAALLAI